MYTYSVANDFSEEPNLQTLDNIIKKNINSYIGLNKKGDELIILFEQELLSEDMVMLNNIIVDHDNSVIIPKDNFITVTPKKEFIKSNSYNVAAIFKMGNEIINYVEVVSYLEKSDANYSIRLYDRTNKVVMAQIDDVNNTVSEIIDMGKILNNVNDRSIIELQVKCNSNVKNNRVYIETVTVYYN